MLFIRTGVHKMLVKIADMEDPDQTVSDLQMQSDLILLCFLIPKAFLGGQEVHKILEILKHLLY